MPQRRIAWVVYVKRPFGGAEQVLDYLGRYTHRVAIANSRLLACEDDRVCFQWKDYRARDKAKTMTLAADEFIRRFLLHVLPNQFRRIRHFGFLANGRAFSRLSCASSTDNGFGSAGFGLRLAGVPMSQAFSESTTTFEDGELSDQLNLFRS